MKKSIILSGLLVAATFAPTGAIQSAFAHIAPCPYCDMTITQDTPTQDNEVALKFGRKRVEYKCVYCAFADAKTEYKGDLSVIAPSEKKGEPIVFSRVSDKWILKSASATTPAFVLTAPLKHKICQEQARAFSSREAAQKYINANKGKLGNVKPLSLDEFVAVAK